jgi:hypothetical protein
VDRGIIATLTDANSCLEKQLEESAQALKEIRALTNKECNDRGARKPFAHSLDNYGWTCGYKISKNHTSVKCMFSKNGHKREATKSNNMGGSQANKKLVGATSKHNSEKFEECCTPPLLRHCDTAIMDSGCTGHFLLINVPCRNEITYVNPLIGRLPNGDTMDSTHTASLDIPELSRAA